MNLSYIFIYLLLLQVSFVFTAEKEKDTLEGFFGNRFSLYPPTPEEEKVVLDFIGQFFDLLNAKDTTHAYFLETTPEFKGVMTYEHFRVFINDLDLDFSQKPKEYNVEFSNDKTKATYTATLLGKKHSEHSNIEIFLILQEDGDWKINSIKIYNIYTQKGTRIGFS